VRTLALVVFACCISTAVYARDLPTDGNGLLEYCAVMVDVADNAPYLQSLSRNSLTEKMGQFSWCAGYLQATEDVYGLTFVNLGIFGMAGLKIEGPEKIRQYAVETLMGPCFPEKAPVLQLGRVLVKWLRAHPERLHELKSTLTAAAFKESFPCAQTASPPQKEAAQPAPPAKP
jgi:hypothetical protein